MIFLAQAPEPKLDIRDVEPPLPSTDPRVTDPRDDTAVGVLLALGVIAVGLGNPDEGARIPIADAGGTKTFLKSTSRRPTVAHSVFVRMFAICREASPSP